MKKKSNKANTPENQAQQPVREIHAKLEIAGKESRIQFNGQGLIFGEGVTYEEFVQAGKQLANIQKVSAFALGDWLNFGTANFKKDYKRAVAETGLVYGTLRNYASTAAAFPVEKRREGLSIAHHMQVQGLKEDKRLELLDKAETENLSVAALAEITPKPKKSKKKKETPEQKEAREIKESVAARSGLQLALEWLTSEKDQKRLIAWIADLKRASEFDWAAYITEAEAAKEAAEAVDPTKEHK